MHDRSTPAMLTIPLQRFCRRRVGGAINHELWPPRTFKALQRRCTPAAWKLPRLARLDILRFTAAAFGHNFGDRARIEAPRNNFDIRRWTQQFARVLFQMVRT